MAKQQEPPSFAEALHGAAQALASALMASDATPQQKQGVVHAMGMLTSLGGAQQQGAPGGAPPGQPPQGAPAMAPGGGTNISQLMGGRPQGPSAAVPGGGGGPSADDMRRQVAEEAS